MVPDVWFAPSRTTHARGLFDADEYSDVVRFFTSRETTPTPTRLLPHLAARLGVGALYVKDESRRFGLSAFKSVGVSYAVDQLVTRGLVAGRATLVAATAGNHGRAVARVARERGLQARIYVPRDTVPARIAALQGEGAAVQVSSGPYEQAVAEAAADAEQHGWIVVSDTSWEGYEDVPRWIMAGYTWILRETFETLGPATPDLVIVQGGVGGLVCAAGSWLAFHLGSARPLLVACEPTAAPSLIASARAGHPVILPPVLATVMAGLRCAEVSPLAWRGFSETTDAYVAIEDEWTFRAMRALAHPLGSDPVVEAGASGAAGLGTLMALMSTATEEDVRDRLRLGSSTRVLVINTEGATDPDLYAKVIE